MVFAMRRTLILSLLLTLGASTAATEGECDVSAAGASSCGGVPELASGSVLLQHGSRIKMQQMATEEEDKKPMKPFKKPLKIFMDPGFIELHGGPEGEGEGEEGEGGLPTQLQHIPRMDNKTRILFEHILETVIGLMPSDNTSLLEGPEDQSTFPDRQALEEIIEAVRAGHHVGDLVQLHHPAVMRAIELYSVHFPVENATAMGMVVTTDLLEFLDGEEDSPEDGSHSNETVFQGDMVAQNATDLSLMQASAAQGLLWYGALWSNSRDIPFCFASDIAASSRSSFLDAVQHFHNNIPCIRLVEVAHQSGWSSSPDSDKRCARGPAIFVQSVNTGCFANVGQVGPIGVCNLGPGCDTLGVSVHEIGHNLGMAHEQSRPDRDRYVTINWQNIQPQYRSQYALGRGADTESTYDFMSIMHYGNSDFGVHGSNGRPARTMTVAEGKSSNAVMGQRMGLSQRDANQLGRMYGCENSVRDFTLCSNSADGCSQGDCVCHAVAGSAASPIVVTTTRADGTTCSRCAAACPAGPSCTFDTACGCGAGKRKVSGATGDGTPCHWCEPGSTPSPTPAPRPRPAPRPSAGGGCQDQETTSINDMQGQRMTCSQLTGHCNHPQLGRAIRSQCCVSCGGVAPTPSPTPEPTSNLTPCRYENDGECDVPSYCVLGTDCADCAGTATACPAPPRPPPPPQNVLPPASKTCKDSTTYRDPRHHDACSGWKSYPCDGLAFSAELKQNCPQACNVPCSSCSPPQSMSQSWSDYCSQSNPAGKAWVSSSDCGAVFYYFGVNAQASAISSCQQYGAGNTCYIYDINGDTCA